MDLNPKQKEAVGHGNGPLLIAAGAGSGKTMTLTSRLTELIRRGVPPEMIVAITFTNKAAEEMRRRVTHNLQLTTNYSRPTTDDKNQNRVVSHKTSVVSQPFIGTFHSFGARILRAEAKFWGRTRYFTIFDNDDSLRLVKKAVERTGANRERYRAGSVSARIGKIKNLLLEPEELLDQTELAIYENYENTLKDQNAFDFDDLIEKAARLLRKSREALHCHQRKYLHLLVDEYQDVNPAQYELIRLLAESHRNLSVVGDDAQAIYGWRFADFRSFLNFERDWQGAKIVVLNENYRSTPTILAAASSIIKNNVHQRRKDLWTKNSDHGPIKVIRAGDEDEEAAFIVETIKKFPASDSRPQNAAILYRTNAQSRAIEQALIQCDVPYRIYGGVKFYERKEIKDIVACLRFALNPKDELAAERIKKTFTKQKALKILSDLPGFGKKGSTLEVINFFLSAGNYAAELERGFRNAEERMENIQELIVFASEFPTLESFVERVSLLQATDLPANKILNSKSQIPNSVNLMTIHMAKGLEFNNVFVSGCAEGLLPHQMSYRLRDELEEERRLMYVAMTRARKNLTLSFAGLPSRFLYEIPAELTEFMNLGGDSKALPNEDAVYID